MKMSSFLQSREWEQFQNAVGRRIWRVDGELIIRHALPFGLNYLYCPRPRSADRIFFQGAEKIAKQERALFLKIDPVGKLPVIASDIRLSSSIQPHTTIAVNLDLKESDLLAAMHEKTRYNIRLAERKGVRVKEFQISNFKFQNNFEKFWSLLRETAERDRFRTHDRGYYEKLLTVHSDEFSNELFFADYQGKTVAAALVNFYRSPISIDTQGGTTTYLHGASSRLYKEVMSSYLLHWRVMQEARRRGFDTYDFWGIDEKKWPGLTRFKKGFGGSVIEYPRSIDVVYNPFWYRVYTTWKKFLHT